MLKVIYYQEKCIGCGICAGADPAWWFMDSENGKAGLRDAISENNRIKITIPVSEQKRFKKVADLCPANIIQLQKEKSC